LSAAQTLTAQTVGNVGLYYVCYRLSRLGWNVMPTARNARGVDVIAYSQDADATRAIQVKALSKRAPVPLGGSLQGLMGDFLIVCRKVQTDTPECFILIPSEVRERAHTGVSPKDGKKSYWLQPKDYEGDAFRESWDRIGVGGVSIPPL
jgi:hypothetical protein